MALAIETRGLGKVYPRVSGLAGIPFRRSSAGGTVALDDINLSLAEGEIFALMGPNGAGKSTLLRVLCTLVLPDAGTARVAGCDLRRDREIRSNIGLVTPNERSFFWRLTCRENLRFFAGLYGINGATATQRLAEVSQQFNLAEILDKRFDACSTGMKHRLALARGLIHQPRVLFLDEPTRSLDPLAADRFRREISRLSNQTGLTIFMVTHDIDEAMQVASRAGVMVGGRLRVLGRPEELRQAIDAAGSGAVTWESLLQKEPAASSPEPDLAPAADPLPTPRALSGALGQLLLFLRRDLLTQLSYRFNFILDMWGVALVVTAFYYLSQLIGDSQSAHLGGYGGNYFSFVLVGIAFLGYQNISLRTYADAIRRGQVTGTLEQMLASPMPLSRILCFSGLWPVIFGTSRMLAYFLAGLLLFRADLGSADLLAASVIMVLSLLALSGFGMLSAGFIMVFKRGDPVNAALAGFSVLLGGVYFPVELLPGWMEVAARLFPLRYTLDAMRRALILGEPLSAMGPEALVLLLFSVVLLPLGLFAFVLAVRIAKRTGTMAQF